MLCDFGFVQTFPPGPPTRTVSSTTGTFYFSLTFQSAVCKIWQKHLFVSILIKFSPPLQSSPSRMAHMWHTQWFPVSPEHRGDVRRLDIEWGELCSRKASTRQAGLVPTEMEPALVAQLCAAQLADMDPCCLHRWEQIQAVHMWEKSIPTIYLWLYYLKYLIFFMLPMATTSINWRFHDWDVDKLFHNNFTDKLYMYGFVNLFPFFFE